MSGQKKQWYERLRTEHWLLIIVTVACLLRVINNYPGFFSYWFDESEYSLRAIRILDNNGSYSLHDLRDHPALFPYMLAVPFAALGAEWYVGRAFTVILGLACLPVLFLIGKEWKDQRLGLTLAALFAVSPLTVYVTREVILETPLSLFLFIAVLCLIRHHKSSSRKDMMLAVLFLVLASLVKETAFLILIPVLIYLILKKAHKKIEFYVALALYIIPVAAVYFLMSEAGFLTFHSDKLIGDQTNYALGGGIFVSTHITTPLLFLGWANIGLVPVILRLRDELKKGKTLRRLASNPWMAFLVAWAICGLIFDCVTIHVAPHYDYNAILPFIPLIGLCVYKNKKWLMVVLAGYLIFSVAGISEFYALRGANEAVTYMQGQIRDNDTIVASDHPVFEFFFRGHTVITADDNALINYNATYIILHQGDRDKFFKNQTVVNRLDHDYTIIHKTPYDVNYYIYKRKP